MSNFGFWSDACAVREHTADGTSVGRCWHFVGRGEKKTCPRHGDVTEVQRRYTETGKLTNDTELARTNDA